MPSLLVLAGGPSVGVLAVALIAHYAGVLAERNGLDTTWKVVGG